MESVLPTAIRDVLAAVGPASTSVQREMEAHAEETGFPIVGPEVGGLLRLLARAVGAERVFEFGSGFGYSATWFAQAVPDDGQVVLTELDADELERARAYIAEAELADVAVFEHGDAFDVFEAYEGPFDVVLLDSEKHRYPDAIEPIREKLAPGGMLVADNALAARYDPEEVAAAVGDGAPGDVADDVAGVVEYLERMRDDPDFETALLPLGEGISVSYYSGAE